MTRPDGSRPNDRLTWVWLAALTLLALGLRLIGVGEQSFKIWDDFFSLRLGVLPPAGILHALNHQGFDAYQEFQPPLYYILMHGFLAFGHSDMLARLVGVLAGTLSVPALYLFGRRHFGRPAAWIGAGFLAVSLYHIEYSQQMRNYVPFLFFALASMGCFSAWLNERRVSTLPWYALFTALMFYTSYMATMVAVAQALALALSVASGRREPVMARIRSQVPLAIAGACAVLAFLPWLPTYWGNYKVLKGITGALRPPVTETLALTFREYVSFYCSYLGYPEAVWPMAALCAVGLGVGLAGKNRRGLLLPLAWTLVTIVMVLGFNRHGLHVRTRHLIAVLPVLFLLAGAGTWALSSWAARLTGRAGAAPVLALVMVLAVNAFNFLALPSFYRREDDRLKALCHEMGVFARGRDRALFWGGDSKWFPAVARFVLDWYLPGEFKSATREHDRRYMRAWMLASPNLRDELRRAEGVVPHGSFGQVDLYDVGVVNTSPLAVWFGPKREPWTFREDFSSLSSLGRMHNGENVYLDKGRAGLVDLDRPGELTYALRLPRGGECVSLRLSFAALFLADPLVTPRSVLRVEAASGEGDFVPVASFSFAEMAARSNSGFDFRKLRFTRQIELSPELVRSGLCRVRFVLDPGPDRGMVFLEGVGFDLAGWGPDHEPGPVRMELENVLANTPVRLWRPGEYDAGALYAFSVAPLKPEISEVGDAEALSAFRKVHPGLPPVLRLGSQREGYEFYDLALSAPPELLAVLSGASPASGEPAPGMGGAGRSPDGDKAARPWLAASLALGGGLARLGETPLPSAGKGPCWVNLNADGSGTLMAKLLFSGERGAVEGAWRAEATRVSPDGRCLTCERAAPCRVVYKLTAPQGFTGVNVVAYPRLYNDLGLGNFYRLSVSRNAMDFESLDVMRANASLVWTPLAMARGAGKKWSLPAKEIYLRFDLSGDGAQLWSTPERPVIVSATLASGRIGDAGTALQGGGNGMAQFLSRPARSFADLLQSY